VVVAQTTRCQAKFVAYKICELTPGAHVQSNILHIKYAEKTDIRAWDLVFRSVCRVRVLVWVRVRKRKIIEQ